jgi:hypothetical protein
MADNADRFERLVQELVELAPDERTRLVAEAWRRAKSLPRKTTFRPPMLSGGTAWVGGDLGREEIYGDDGRANRR